MDRITYLKGLLYLVSTQKSVGDNPKYLIRKFIESLDFAPDFYDYTLKTLITTPQALEDPPLFSRKYVVKIFIRDCIKIAFCDHVLHLHEFEWLHSVVIRNHLSNDWYAAEVFGYLNVEETVPEPPLEIGKLLNDTAN